MFKFKTLTMAVMAAVCCMTVVSCSDDDDVDSKTVEGSQQALDEAAQAIENAEGSGQIRVELRNGENAYEISVEDSGPGVPEDNIDKLFTPNFTTKNSGTGLGLAISRNIVDKCNGSISYKKSFNLGGACFTVCLPKTQKNA